MASLDVLHEFRSPDEELKSKKGTDAKSKLRKNRREHNCNVIIRAEREREQEHATMPSAAPTTRDDDPDSPQVCAIAIATTCVSLIIGHVPRRPCCLETL